MLLERRSGDVSAMIWKVRGGLISWANSSVGIQSCPTPPRHPAVRPDPNRPWYVRVLDSTSLGTMLVCVLVTHLSNPKPGHTEGGSGRGARRGGARQDGTPTEQFAQEISDPRTPQGIEETSPERFFRSTNKIVCKPNVGTKSPVDNRFVSGLSPGREALFVPGCRPVGRCFFSFRKPFSCKACSGTFTYFVLWTLCWLISFVKIQRQYTCLSAVQNETWPSSW